MEEFLLKDRNFEFFGSGLLGNSSSNSTNGTGPLFEGFIAAGVSVFLFGSNFVPVKKFETGDGQFFQWILCSAILLVGMAVQAIRLFPTFYPLPMLGGVLWASGNVMVVPILKTIGLGQGILVWGSFNLIAGWTTGRFGLFGLTPEVPSNLTLNYIGMSMCFLSAFIYMFIKSNTESIQPVSDVLRDPLLPVNEPDEKETIQINDASYIESMSPTRKRVVGTVLAVISGLLYGMCFTPTIYVQNNYPNASQNGLDYVFSFFCGIYATSSFYFMIYCIVMKNRPRVYPQAILPAIVSGVMWGIASAAWMMANSILSEAVSFPIVTSVPGIIGALWGVIAFKEIRGVRNFVILGFAFCVTIAGSILTGFSKA